MTALCVFLTRNCHISPLIPERQLYLTDEERQDKGLKSNRQSAILDIIEKNSIETQEELIGALEEAGYKVTQATVSRDIRELKLTKTMSDKGKYKYVLPAADKGGHHAYSSAIAAAVTNIDAAQNLVVIKTFPGMAQAVAAGLDSADIEDVLGCVAGDDTVFLACRSTEAAAYAAAEIKGIIGR